MNKPEWRGKMRQRKLKWFGVFFLCLMLVFSFGRTTFAQSQSQSAGSFYLEVSTSGRTLIAPTAIPYEEGQTIREALLASPYSFKGLDGGGYIAAIEGVTGNYMLFYDGGGYDLDIPASQITALGFAEQEVYSEAMISLIRTAGAYRERTDHVQNYGPAADAYRQALKGFRSADAQTAQTLLDALNQAIKEYEALLAGQKYQVTVSATQGNKSVKNPQITVTDQYGNVTTAQGTKISVIAGTYHFSISDGTWNRTEGELKVKENKTLKVALPNGEWFGQVQVLNANKEAYAFTQDTKTHTAEYEIDDTVGTTGLYLYAEQGADIPDINETELRTIYTRLDGIDASTYVRSWESKTNSMGQLLQNGMEGRSIVLEGRYTGADGYQMIQSYTLDFVRIPTLHTLTVREGNTSLLTKFEPANTTYELTAVSDQISVAGVPYGEDGYTVSYSGTGMSADGTFSLPANGTYQFVVTVTHENGRSRSYEFTVHRVTAVSVKVTAPEGTGLVVENEAGDPIGASEGDTYRLIPGKTYRYIGTKNTWYHTTAEFTAEDGLEIAVKEPDAGDALKALKLYDRATISTRKEYTAEQPFIASEHQYTYRISDANSSVYMQATSDAYTVTAQYEIRQAGSSTAGNRQKDVVVTKPVDVSGGAIYLPSAVFKGGYSEHVVLRLSMESGDVTYYQDYELTLAKTLHLSSMQATDGTSELILSEEDGTPVSFDRDRTEYYTMVLYEQDQICISAAFMNQDTATAGGGGYYALVNGEQQDDLSALKIPLQVEEQTETVTIQVKHEDRDSIETEYQIIVQKTDPVQVTFHTEPEDAIVFVTNQVNGRTVEKTDGSYGMTPGYRYIYTVSRNGYQTQQVTGYQAPSEATEITVTLEKAEDNPAVKDLSAYWPSFRADDNNNGVVNVKTPVRAEDAVLYWATKLGDGYGSAACGCPIIVDGYLYTYAGTTLYKVDTISGEVVATGKLDHSSSFAINNPTYGAGMIFVGLANGTVQAFNASTLESLWIYKDSLGGQPNCPIVYHDGYIYTGFWMQEDADAHLVCLSVTDEDPSSTDEQKLASWTYTRKGGFYWAGAYVSDDFLLVGTDDGETGCQTGYGHILSMDPKSGKVLDDVTLPYVGDVRSSVTYDKVTGDYYFTTKGGYFYRISVNADGTFKENSLQSVALYNYASDATNPAMSTCTPVIWNGRAYVGVSGTSQFGAYSGHNITVIDLNSMEIAYTVRTMGYPQTSGLLTTAYDSEEVYVYFFDNFTPGKLRMLSDRPGQTEPKEVTVEEYNDSGKITKYDTAYVLFTPVGEQAQYAICSPIVDEYGTIYFKNDSAYLMALGNTIKELKITKGPDKTEYKEGETFDPEGMEVTAVYENGMERDVTAYVTYSPDPLTTDDTEFQIRFEHVMYQNRDGAAGVKYAAPVAMVQLDVQSSVYYGDVNQDKNVDVKDVSIVYAAAAGKRELSEEEQNRADVNGDGQVDAEDAKLIYEYVAGRRTSLEPEQPDPQP